jgi:hypothetical protein
MLLISQYNCNRSIYRFVRDSYVNILPSFCSNFDRVYSELSIVCQIFPTEWASDCCLTPTQHLFSYIMARTINFQWNDDEVRFVLDQHTEFDIYSARALKQQSTVSEWGRQTHYSISNRIHHPDPEPIT